jgi:hypothetical protein
VSEFQYQHAGGCACGAVSYRFFCDLSLEQIEPRACQCQFCRPRGSSYISATHGRLEVRVRDARFLYSHVFGTDTADFVHCGSCNHLVYVSSEVDGRLYGLVVEQSLYENLDVGRGRAVDFSAETLEARLARRAATWIPEVVVVDEAQAQRGADARRG